jgi:hypothetical protein
MPVLLTKQEILMVSAFLRPVRGKSNAIIHLVTHPSFLPILAKAMFVDWTGANGVGKGDISIVSKGNSGEGVGQIPVLFHKNVAVGKTTTTYNMPPVSSTLIEDPPQQGEIPCGDGPFCIWQGADMR